MPLPTAIERRVAPDDPDAGLVTGGLDTEYVRVRHNDGGICSAGKGLNHREHRETQGNTENFFFIRRLKSDYP